MNKYISKSMLYNKKYNMCWTALALFGLLFINIFTCILSIYYHGYANYNQLLEIPFSFIFVLSITFAVDLYNKKDVAYYHLLTTPINRDSIIITNLLTPIIPSILSFLLYGVFSSLIFFLNQCNAELYITLWSNLFFTFSIIFFTNAICQLFQLIINNYIAAVILPMMYSFIFIPYSLAIILALLINIFFGPDSFKFNINFNNIFNQGVLVYSFIFIAIAILVILLAVYINRKIKIENFSKLFLFILVEIIFKIFTSTFISIVLIFIGNALFNLEFLNDTNRINSLIVLFIITILSSISYILINKFYFKKTIIK